MSLYHYRTFDRFDHRVPFYTWVHTLFIKWPWRILSLLNSALFCDYMAQGLNQNLSLKTILERYTFPRAFLEKRKADLLALIANGTSLGNALDTTEILDPFGIYVIKIAEKSDTLPSCFRLLAKTYHLKHNLRKKYQKLLAYPLFLSATLLLTFFSFAPMLIDHIQDFLASTHNNASLKDSLFVQIICHFSWHTAGLMMLFGLLLFYGSKRFHRLSYFMEKVFLYCPVLGPLKKLRTLHTLFQLIAYQLEAGLSFQKALQVQASFFPSLIIKKGLKKTLDAIAMGIPFSKAMQQHLPLPPFVTAQLKHGEATGTLDHATHQVALLLEKQSAHKMAQLQQYIQPFFLTLIGLFLMWGVSSVLYPLYEGLGNGL
jgi:type II secretory pathway component PulF